MQRNVIAAASTYTDKPIPNAFWRLCSAFVYLIPMIDSWMLGVTGSYNVLPFTRILAAIAGAQQDRSALPRHGMQVFLKCTL